jgi:hypothetical protein
VRNSTARYDAWRTAKFSTEPKLASEVVESQSLITLNSVNPSGIRFFNLAARKL